MTGLEGRSRVRIVLLAAVLGGASVITGSGAAPTRSSAADRSGSPPVAAGAWTAAEPMPQPRSEIAAAVVDGRIIVVGGLEERTEGPRAVALDDVLAFDPTTGAWQELAPMPAPRDHMGVAEADGRVWVSGGGAILHGEHHADLWAYDPAADTWEERAPMPETRWQHAMVALDGVLYVVGGFIGGASDHRPIWAYDIATDQWRTDLPPMPTPRDHLAAAVVDGRIVVVGGRQGRVNLPVVELYDPTTDTWVPGPELAMGRSGFALGLLSDGLHATGGEDLEAREVIGSHERLDLGTMTWSELPELPSPRHGVASAVVDDAWFVIGGGTEAGLSTSTTVARWEVYPRSR